MLQQTDSTRQIFVDVDGETITLTIEGVVSNLIPTELGDYIRLARMSGETYLLHLLEEAELAVVANTDFD